MTKLLYPFILLAALSGPAGAAPKCEVALDGRYAHLMTTGERHEFLHTLNTVEKSEKWLTSVFLPFLQNGASLQTEWPARSMFGGVWTTRASRGPWWAGKNYVYVKISIKPGYRFFDPILDRDIWDSWIKSRVNKRKPNLFKELRHEVSTSGPQSVFDALVRNDWPTHLEFYRENNFVGVSAAQAPSRQYVIVNFDSVAGLHVEFDPVLQQRFALDPTYEFEFDPSLGRLRTPEQKDGNLGRQRQGSTSEQ